MSLKIGIYGGTFNPPHIGHVKAAESFVSAIDLDKLIIIPDFMPPHKQHSGVVDAGERLKMCGLAFSHIKNAEISDIEIKRGGNSYTYQTLEALSGDDRELYLLVGTDMFLTLSQWRRAERIFELATICVVRRENDSEKSAEINDKLNEYKRFYNARVIEIPHDAVEASSTDARMLDFDSTTASEVIPQNVLEYIKKMGLYK